MTPEQKVHKRQRRLQSAEHLIGEQYDCIEELAEELNVPQSRRDAIKGKIDAAKQAIKDVHDECEQACGDIGVQPLSGGGPKPPQN